MKNIIQQFKTLAFAASLTLGVIIPVLAEDTEVYIGDSNLPSEVRPNLVFIFDTSGSMSGNVTTTTTNGIYDSSITYPGSCDSGRVYWSDTGSAPTSCGTNNYFPTTSNKCDASLAPLAGTSGFASGIRAARYNNRWGEDRWHRLSTSERNDFVECKGDWGTHGESNASNPYPADEDDGGPWSNNAGNGFDWDNKGDNYIFYSANYMNWRTSNSTSVTQTRLEIVQGVFSSLIDSMADDINLAVMRYDNKSQSNNKGGYFVMPMQQLIHTGGSANATDYKDAVNAFTPDGYTPLAETLYESYLFYRGDPVKFGDDTDPGTNHADVFTGNDYDSPIEYQCQKNFVILLTDGEPTYDTNADNNIEGLTGFSAVTGGNSCNGNCLDELADYMYTKDCRDPDLDGKQNVITYTIGFQTNQTLLQTAASKGGGEYFTANDTAELTDAFTSIITEILEINTTFIAPAVSVNAFNRFNHRSELYYATFKPTRHPNWNGNVKRYELKTLTAGEPPEIVDANGALAVNTSTGFFDADALSFWTNTADLPPNTTGDGDEVTLGGAASRLTLPRTMYTYTGATAATNEDLTATANALTETNAAITKTMLGNASMTDAERTNYLTWARGVDILDQDGDLDVTDVRPLMGDPLHSKPKVITYGGTEANPDITLFVGTNEGHLTAIDTDDGSEVFTFMPQELLSNLPTLYDDSANMDHPYGMDGPLTAWFNDLNGNGLLYDGATLDTGEHVYLYMGMRRGGRNYYSLDATNRSAPKLKWVIKGGSTDFTELGQTWSAPSGGKIKVGGVDKMVMIFGGGYDVAQDANTTLVDDVRGRAIYIVDANTGQKIWQAGPAGSDNGADPDLVLSEMTNSIPADVRAIDIDLDGYIDRLYVGDMGGKIWRFDIDIAGNTGAVDLATGGVIAKLGDTSINSNVAADNRRFYYSPDPSLSEDETYINLAIGSGYRAHPLDKVIHDAFFILRDKNVDGPARDTNGDPVYTAVTINDLYDATANLLGQGTSSEIATATTALEGSEGLFMWLHKADGSFVGEKVLSKSLTYSGIVAFTTFTPVASASGSCSPSSGVARLYLVNVEDLTPVQDNDISGGNLTHEDRSVTLVRGGIPPEPTIIFHKDDTVLAVGTELPDAPEISRRPRKVYWYTE